MKYGQCRLARWSITTAQESRFQAAIRSDIRSGILPESLLDESQESRFQGAKRRNMGSAVQQLGQLG